MAEKRIAIVGAGKRVMEDVLPVLNRLRGSYSLAGLYARSGRTLETPLGSLSVQPLESLEGEALAELDMLYVVVGKNAVHDVLSHLEGMDTTGLNLLMETPVLLFKHLSHLKKLQGFNSVAAAEDATRLPIWDVVSQSSTAGPLGEIQRAEFRQSAYKYHGVAMFKKVLGETRVVSATRKRDGDRVRRTVRFRGKKQGIMIEPRDYERGSMLLTGSGGVLSDDPESVGDGLLLEAVVEGDRCAGFRAGDHHHRLDDDEIFLLDDGEATGSRSVMSRMHGMKRVGLLRMLREMHAGEKGYDVSEALDDMVTDYVVDRAGFYLANPLWGIKGSMGRALLSTITRPLA